VTGRVPPALLSDLLIITSGPVGRTWLDTHADRTTDSTAAFTSVHATQQPPPLPEVEHILTRVLSNRFALAPPAAAA